MQKLETLVAPPSNDYELLDSGEGEKLERYGNVVISRPDPQALWEKKKSLKDWKSANAHFERSGLKAKWKKDATVPEKWPVEIGGLKLWVSLTPFKHTGIFPEQVSNWNFIRELIEKNNNRKEKIAVLNLFGYTGGATLAAAKGGAEVCHVDGSKTSINWAKENAKLSGLEDRPIRWILDDVKKFVDREVRRGKKYDGIIMDPPAFGHGAKKELWKIEDHFLPLLNSCKKLVSADPLFFIINGYSSGYSPIAYANNLQNITSGYGGLLTAGELAIAESGTGRLLPSGIFARWMKQDDK